MMAVGDASHDAAEANASFPVSCCNGARSSACKDMAALVEGAAKTVVCASTPEAFCGSLPSFLKQEASRDSKPLRSMEERFMV